MVDANREWLLRVVYNSDAGQIDVDYLVDTMEEAHLAIKQGPHGMAAVVFIGMMRNTGVAVPTLETLANPPIMVDIPTH